MYVDQAYSGNIRNGLFVRYKCTLFLKTAMCYRKSQGVTGHTDEESDFKY